MINKLTKVQVPRFISFVNAGVNPVNSRRGWVGRRRWKACVEYGFLSAGQNTVFSKQLERLTINDVIAAFIRGKGYVGIGKVIDTAIPIKNFRHNGKSLKGLPYIKDELFDNSENDKSEYVVRVDWLKTVDSENAYWRKNYGLFANQSVQCSLENQPKTIKFLEESFQVEFV